MLTATVSDALSPSPRWRAAAEQVARHLLTCPFCGGMPTIRRWHGGGPMRTWVGCTGAYAVGCPAKPAVTGGTPTKAASAWNTRY